METYIKKIHISDQELFEIFPEAKEVIPEKLKEWEQKKDEITDIIKKKLKIIQDKSAKNNQWFWREWLKINEVEELANVDSHIARLKRQLALINGRKVFQNTITEEQIQTALNVPMQNLFNQKFRKSGGNLISLCPFHNEKSPSFYIYLKTNTCWCFGCQQGGNTIKSVRLLYGYSFREAIHYLIGK